MNTRPSDRATARWLAVIAIVSVVAACSGDAADRAAAAAPTGSAVPSQRASAAPATPSTATNAAASAVPPGSADPATTLGPDIVSLDPGRHAGRHLVGGRDTSPGYSVVVPAGWFGLADTFVVKNPRVAESGPVLGLSVWDVGTVFHDPCHWDGQGFDPGPKVDDLVAALVAQPMRNPTTPTDVALAGYSGQYLELSVPADMKSSRWSDFDECDVDADGYRDFQGWLGVEGGNRHAQVPGQVDRLWVLDVDGHRLVVDATYSPDTTSADRDELARIVESLAFTAAS